MCLAVPGRIVAIDDSGLLTMAEVDFHGVRRQVCIDTVDASVGDYVVAHAGVAVAVMDAVTALGAISDLEAMTSAEEAARASADASSITGPSISDGHGC